MNVKIPTLDGSPFTTLPGSYVAKYWMDSYLLYNTRKICYYFFFSLSLICVPLSHPTNLEPPTKLCTFFYYTQQNTYKYVISPAFSLCVCHGFILLEPRNRLRVSIAYSYHVLFFDPLIFTA